MSYKQTIINLVTYLNRCRDAYYNGDNSLISDEQYDKLFDELKRLEEESGIVFSNSPTQTVGYTVVSDLKKVEHKKPLLSMDKTKSYETVLDFCQDQDVLFMYKCDGLTCQLTYKDGQLIRAETRGDGIVGEDITHNALTFIGVPKTIGIQREITITGEALINREDFLVLNEKNNNAFKNVRNLASGSVRQLDSSVCAKRYVRFIVWNANDLSEDGTMESGLLKAQDLGFTIVHYYRPINLERNLENIETTINNIKKHTSKDFIPIDGVVIIYNDIEYGDSLGATSHHYRNSLAFKFYEDVYTTTITDIDYTIGKTGFLTPTAVFEPVEIDGTTVTRASVHNMSILAQLNLCVGDSVEIYKANEIIPQVKCNYTKHENPEAYINTKQDFCPYCGSRTRLVESNDTVVLMCGNGKSCPGVLLKKFANFVSKPAMNIDGLSEKTLEKLINCGYLHTFEDVFTKIREHSIDICRIEGFGEKCVKTLLDSIEKATHTTLDRVLIAISIDNIGKQNAKILSDHFENNPGILLSTFTNHTRDQLIWRISSLQNFGTIMATSFVDYFLDIENKKQFIRLCSHLKFEDPKKEQKTLELANMNFVITGSLEHFKSRDTLVEFILAHSGKVQSSVSSQTTYLINNDANSNSLKNKKAKELSIPIITEQEFLKLVGEEQKPQENQTPKAMTKTRRRLF